jgi:hypothetical protein
MPSAGRRPKIEDNGPDVPDGMVQFADGPADLAGPPLPANQAERQLQSQPGREDPLDDDVVHALGDPVAIFEEIPGHVGWG